MYIKQIYTGCLAQAAYYIESEGEAAIVDPLRDIDTYLELAKARGAKIKYVLETHFHADFVSGHLDLAKETGAIIVYGPEARPKFKVYNAQDGEMLPLGKLTIQVLHTPGHSPESTCYLLYDETGKPHALFSGDTLFVGDVGRPDLRGESMSKEQLGALLYNSLQNKIKPLPDDIIVYPAHGPGSACGKNIGRETYSTLGKQKQNNWALQDMTQEEFIKTLLDGLMPPPQYFSKDFRINQTGYDAMEKVLQRNLKPLAPEAFEKEIDNGAVVLDTRNPDTFEKGFIPGAINIGLNGSYAIWAGTLLTIEQPLLLVCEEGKEYESVMRLARIGYENIKGYLQGGMEAWTKSGRPLDMVISIEAEEFGLDIKHDPDLIVLDVRRPAEYQAGHVLHAINMPLQDMANALTEAKQNEINKEEKIYVHCQSGYRSMIAASLLKRQGYRNVRNVYGGFLKISKTDIPLVNSITIKC